VGNLALAPCPAAATLVSESNNGIAGVVPAYKLRELLFRRRDGEVVRRVAPSALAPQATGRVTGLLSIGIEDVSPGDYELALRIEDRANGETHERVEPFCVTRRQVAGTS
jgi:hypothetical protein